MDLWYKLDTIVRSWVAETKSDPTVEPEAWAELESFLRREFDFGKAGQTGAQSGRAYAPLPTDVRQAFLDLEIEPGASIQEARKAYRRLLVQYHPDRHNADPDRYDTAVEITKRLTLAYQRICVYHGS